MRVPHERDVGDPVEDRFDLVGRVVDIVGEDVLVDRAPGRGVHGQHRHIVVAEVLDGTNPQLAHVVVASSPLVLVGLGVELLAGPEGRGLGGGVEVGGLVEHPKVVVAHESPGTLFLDHIDAGEGLGAVADDVAQADDLFDPARFDVFQDPAQGGRVAMDIADNGGRHDECLTGSRVWGPIRAVGSQAQGRRIGAPPPACKPLLGIVGA